MPIRTRKGSSKVASTTSKAGRSTSTAAAAANVNPLRVTRSRAASSSSEQSVASYVGGNHSFLSQYSHYEHEDQGSSWCFIFILPEGTTEATCDMNLSSAHQLCTDFPVRCKWLAEKECLELKPMHGNIFVLSPFEGPAFEYLEKCRETDPNFEIVGPQCVRYAMLRKEEVSITNRGSSPFTLGMRNMLVTLSGNPDAEKKHITQLIQRMNGIVTPIISSGVTHVVADNIISEKCTIAYESGIPVMTSEWVKTVWENTQNDLSHATDPQYVKFACPVFHKLVICVSQVSLDMKTALRNAIEANGGRYTADFKRNVTNILVIPKGGGEKYRHAIQWEVPCVTPDWVDACKSAGHVVPLKDYPVPTVPLSTSTPINSMVADKDMSSLSNIPFSSTNPVTENITIDTTQQSVSAESVSAAAPKDPTITTVPVDDLSDHENSADSSDNELYLFNERKIKVAIDDSEEKLKVVNLIEECNGKIVNEDFEILIQQPIYSSDLQVDPSIKRCTKQWVADCIEAGTFDVLKSFCHNPLPAFEGMTTILKDLVVSITKYTNSEKEYISYLVENMGGVYQDVFARKSATKGNTLRTTHLICPDNDNDKFRAAKRWKTTVITVDWILDCFTQKKLVNEAPYNPELGTDSQSNVSCMPQTPKDIKGGKAKTKTRNITSNFFPSAEKQQSSPQPGFSGATGGNVFKHPFPIDAAVADNNESCSSSNPDASFLAFQEEARRNGVTYDKYEIPEDDSSFQEYLANRTPPPEEEMVEDGSMTKKEFEKFKREILALGDIIALPTNPNPIRRNSTPISVMIRRTWEEIMEKCPAGDFLTKFGKYDDVELAVQKMDSPNTSHESRAENQTEAFSSRPSSKRSSDTSLEDEVVGPVSSKKKIRFSSTESEADLDEPNLHQPVASSKSSMEALQNLLSNDQDDDGPGIPQPLTKIKKKKVAKVNRNNEKINPEELDEPHVVWDQNEDVEPPKVTANGPCKVIRNNPGSTRSGISTRGNSSSSSSNNISREGRSRTTSDSSRHSAEVKTTSESALSLDISQNAVFMFSALSDGEKAKAIEVITSVGGRISNIDGFDKDAVALIASGLARSEKVLASVAAGKCLLTMDYIYACEEAECLLPLTEKHMWRQENGKSVTEKQIAKAGAIWLHRILKDPEDKSMRKMKFYLVERNPQKRAAYSNLIHAAGGEVVDTVTTATCIIYDSKSGDIISTYDQRLLHPPLYLSEVIYKSC